MKYKTYRKEEEYSYALGAFPTMELIHSGEDLLVEIFLSDKYTGKRELVTLLEEKGIKYEVNDKQLARISDKKNTYLAGVFRKAQDPVTDGNHIVLVEPGDMGNMGTILRTMLAFEYRDLVLIGEHCDPYHPKVVRASMGALFKERISHYSTIEEYLREWGDRILYPFMLEEEAAELESVRPEGRYSLVFGNEGSGLPVEYADYGRSVIIPQSNQVDSLNLTIAAGIAMYHFSRGEARG